MGLYRDITITRTLMAAEVCSYKIRKLRYKLVTKYRHLPGVDRTKPGAM